MIDTTGGFDPRKLLQMQSSPPQTPIDMYRSDTPDVSMGMSPPQIPVSFQQSPPQVPIDMYRSDSPPPISMQASPPQTPVSSSRSDTPTYTNPNIIPNVPPHQPIGGGVVPGITGDNTSLPQETRPQGVPQNWVAQPGSNNQTWNPPPPSDPRLAYGYNPGQWAINRNIESKAPSSFIEGFSKENWLKNAPGYVSNLPDEQEYNAYREQIRQPYNQSVANESAAGRMPGSSGQTPNYTAPTTIPTSLPQQQQQSIAAPVIPSQDRWLGTQRRQPTYF